MMQIDFERLRRLGLSPALAQQAMACAAAADPNHTGLQLRHLTEVHRETVRVHDGLTEHSARVRPRLMRRLADAPDGIAGPAAALAVGDWVLASAGADAWVHERVPPLSHLQRRDADGRRHAVVSNVDTALLVMGLDDDFNPRRLERYLALVQSSGVLPVIVLTKADVLVEMFPAEPGALEARVASLLCRMPARIDVLAVDGTDPATAARLAPYLGAGQTLVLLGSSGAGKSTLTNTLLGAPVQDTGAVRTHDSRGKHTTTSRSLHMLPCGACVIDTPGLRALRPDVDAAALAATFDDIEALSAQCRFRDCQHHDEPGCAVREGVHGDRLRNYQKLLRESRRDSLSAIERQQQVATWKARGKATRAWMKCKRGEV